MATVQNHGRDPDRTPTQWSSELYAGFSSVRPWLPLADKFGAINVESIALRRSHPALSVGGYSSLDVADGVLGYRRDEGDDRVAVLLN